MLMSTVQSGVYLMFNILLVGFHFPQLVTLDAADGVSVKTKPAEVHADPQVSKG